MTFQQDLKTLSYFARTCNLQRNFSEVRSGKNFGFLKRFLDYKRIELNKRFRSQRDYERKVTLSPVMHCYRETPCYIVFCVYFVYALITCVCVYVSLVVSCTCS